MLIGDTLVAIGLTDTIEGLLVWTPFGHARTRDKATGAIDTRARTGDVIVGVMLIVV